MLARSFIAVVVAALIASQAEPASAQSVTVTVLGIESRGNDSSIARAVTLAVRDAARRVTGWTVDSRDVDLSQLVLAHGCAQANAACLGEIGTATIRSDVIVFGSLERTTADARYELRLVLSLFDTEERRIAETVTDTLAPTDADADSLRTRADRYVRGLRGEAETGSLRVRVSNAEQAEVRVDGSPRGVVTGGIAIVTGLAPGSHVVEVVSAGRGTEREDATVEAGRESIVDIAFAEHVAPPPPPPELRTGGSSAWLGWVMLGTGAALVGAGVYASSEVGSVNDDPDFTSYRDRVPQGLDACDEADRDVLYPAAGMSAEAAREQTRRVRDLCSTGSTFGTLQWVFFGAGAALGIVGGIVLGTSGEDAHERASTELVPAIGANEATVDLLVRF